MEWNGKFNKFYYWSCHGTWRVLPFREVVCWYWKINEGVEHLENISNTLKSIENTINERSINSKI